MKGEAVAPDKGSILTVGGLTSCLLAVSALALAASRVWVADDAYITFRHVNQFLSGNGLTYNTLERVEGFTHPLWAGLLCVFALMGAPISGAAMAMNLGCAAVLLAMAAWSDRDNGPLAVALLVSCSGFIDFSTSGLETPLTMLLVYVAYQVPHVLSRPGRTGMALGFAYLCHPDVALLGLAPFLLALSEVRQAGWRSSRAAVARFVAALGAAPIAWHLFRLWYYSDLLPNTYYAKNGGSYWNQGLTYVADFARYAPLSALGLVWLGGLAWADASGTGDETRLRRTFGVLAILAHMGTIARVGGDFMGFRLLLPDLAAAAALSSGSLGRFPPKMRLGAQTGLLAAAMAALFIQPDPPHERGLIVNERLNFAGAFVKARDAFTGRPRHPWWNEGRLFRSFQECVGEPSLIVEYPNIGYYGVAVGTRVSLIDGNGLVDRFVARNWAARKGLPRGRPGHEGKMTLDYALQRNIHFVREVFEPYKSTMATDYGILLSLDPQILCTLPGKADSLRELKRRLIESPTAKSLDTLQFLERLERRDGVRIDEVCKATTFSDCSPAGMNRTAKGR